MRWGRDEGRRDRRVSKDGPRQQEGWQQSQRREARVLTLILV
jgi:hypothetical protein